MKFKTLYKKELDLFGIIEFASEDSKELIVYTSTMPRLYAPSATLDLLIQYYNALEPNQKFEDLVKDHGLELIEVELSIIS